MLNPKQRKALWTERGGNLSELARAAKVSKNHVRLVLTGERRSPLVERMVAEVLDVPVTVAFPPRAWKRQRKTEAA